MFYNYLIKAFLEDETLFSDVKVIVDCPLKCDPADVIKACREHAPPHVIMQMLEVPGADLEFPELKIEHPYGRNSFLKKFTSLRPEEIASRTRKIVRRATIASCRNLDPNQLGIEPPKSAHESYARKVEPSSPSLALPQLKRHHRRSTLYNEAPVDMAKLLFLDSAAANNLEHEGNEQLISMLESERKLCDPGEEDRHKANERPPPATVTKSSSNMNLEDLRASPNDAMRGVVLSQYYIRLQNLGVRLIQLWAHFYRRVSSNWLSDRNSLLPLPKPFIVPGGRFIEIYYWDSYWIIRGLLSSGMITQARDACENFLYMVERFGFIPNGSRKYYQDRSQPPFLSSMLRAYYHATHDLEFIMNAFPLLEKEYAFWMNERLGHAVRIDVPNPSNPNTPVTCMLNRYYSLEVTPRPESYRIDEITGKLYLQYKGAAESLQEHFRAIRAGAESGWDFSSRWLRPAIEGKGEGGIRPDQTVDKVLHKLCLIDIDTCNVIPCDLNGVLYAVEEDLRYFAELLNLESLAIHYASAKERRRKAMMLVNWDPVNERWMDYDMKTQKLSKVMSAASFVPLWAGVNPEPMDDARRIQLASSLTPIIRPYGIVATHVKAGLQWDSPNIWACSHHMAVDFMCGGRFWELEKSAETDQGPAMQLGINWASRFVNTVLDRFDFRGTCSEKYHCYRAGKSGMDGEYVTQEGFGWTNGVVLDFLEKFGTKLCPQGLYITRKPGELYGR